MKKNKFMTRVFSAMENQETEVLDQIQNDLEIAKEDGELDSEEYKITWDPDQEVFVLHDKINNEHTEISEDEEAAFYMTDMTDANEGIPTPEESVPELSVNDEVKWTDELGHEHQGMITMISDGIATILENEVEVAAPIESLMKVEAPVEEVTDVDYIFSERERSLKEYKVTYKVKNDPTNKGADRKYTDAVYAADKRSVSSALREMLKANDPEVKFEIISIEDTGKSSSRFSKVEDYDFSSTKYYARKIDEDKLIEVIFGAQGDVQASILRYCADNNYKLSEVLSAAKKMVKSRKDDEDWGNFEPSDRSSLMKKLDIRTFSHIDSPESFREYAHKVMKEAHGDEYSEEVTNKVVDDLLADNPNNDYGELIGRLTSGFGEKEFSYDWSKNEKSAVVLKNPDGTHEVVSIQSEDDEERLKSYKEEGCRVVKRCKNTGEADKYIEERSLTRAYSFIEKTFAKSDAVKKLEFEVSRIKDLYNDVKVRQKGETDPVMKSRNKMLLQEIKVKLEQAKLAVYKKEFEESRSKNFSFVEKTFGIKKNFSDSESDWDQIKDLVNDQLPAGVIRITKVRGSETDKSYKVEAHYHNGTTHIVEVPINGSSPLDNYNKATNSRIVDNREGGSDYDDEQLELIRSSKSDVKAARVYAAGHHKTPKEVLEKLSSDNHEGVREAVAKNRKTPAEVLEKLSNDNYEAVRHEVAMNPNTPPKALVKLTQDKSWYVSAAASRNPNTPKADSDKAHQDLIRALEK